MEVIDTAMMRALTDFEELKEREQNLFVVVHPLDDEPEQKVDTEKLGPMRMTLSVRLSLLSLRAYLLIMMGLVVYHVLGLAGLFAGHAR
jgi:hypothetical protein